MEYKLHSVHQRCNLIILVNADVFWCKNTFHLLLVLVRATTCCVDVSVIIDKIILVHKIKKFFDLVRGKGPQKYFIAISKFY